jgi:hypothetical protein
MRLNYARFALAVTFCVPMSQAQVTGSGTKNAIPIWTGTTVLGNSKIAQVGGSIGINTTKPGAQLDVESASTAKPAVVGSSSGSIAGYFQTTATASTALQANAAATTGSSNGIYGVTTSPDGWGIIGANNAASGTGGGVLGTSTNGQPGVNGSNLATSGFASGVYGSTSSPGGVVALLRAQQGGDILTGQFGVGLSAVNVVRIDSAGKGFFDGGTQTGGADFAESVAVAKESIQYEPGDVLIIDTTGKRQLKISTQPYSTLVAGIYSTKPGVLATTHKMDEMVSNEIPLAIVGIVPCKVSAENGPIQPGDLLVTSSMPGYAMKGTDRTRMLGAVVGKALEPLSEGKGIVGVLVTLQ